MAEQFIKIGGTDGKNARGMKMHEDGKIFTGSDITYIGYDNVIVEEGVELQIGTDLRYVPKRVDRGYQIDISNKFKAIISFVVSLEDTEFDINDVTTPYIYQTVGDTESSPSDSVYRLVDERLDDFANKVTMKRNQTGRVVGFWYEVPLYGKSMSIALKYIQEDFEFIGVGIKLM